MIAARCDLGAVKFSRGTAFDPQTVGAFFDVGAHAPKIFSESGDAVALLHTELRGIANLDSLLGIWAESGEHGQLVDEKRNQVARDYATFELRSLDREIAHQFTLLAFEIHNADRGA